MLRLSSRLRSPVAAAVVAMVGSLLFGVAPVQAVLDRCLPQFKVLVESRLPRAGSPSEVIIGPAGPLTGTQRISGYAVDRCPGDGKFDNALRFRYEGRVWLPDGTSYAVTDFTPRAYSSSPAHGEWRLIVTGVTHVTYDRHSARGRAEFGVSMTDGNGNSVYATRIFYVRRDVKMTFNAGPEPVKKGDTITVSGKVTRLTFNAAGVPRYLPFVAKGVDVHWNPTGSGGWRSTRVGTNASGVYSKDFVATTDAVWYARTGANSYYAAPVNKPGDFVDVQ